MLKLWIFLQILDDTLGHIRHVWSYQQVFIVCRDDTRVRSYQIYCLLPLPVRPALSKYIPTDNSGV